MDNDEGTTISKGEHMNNDKTGGPAFPRAGYASTVDSSGEDGREGMTLRDYFAGQALMGILACNLNFEAEKNVLPDQVHLLRARIAYIHANAMIAARRKYDED